ncbi:hypothetical protein BN59_01555 [Legionella massiliensis]|uniref:Uncharacterized protein n=1 Tax=Legionella massiliensis TaxID=1034943 RepID=A0A078KZQ8_9GAMM|nr:hypothetical protein BN59_01555 [Legionella massiliensis]CEE13011.1 hypothetical protein BN1094_01555 [Legionella massiliensis]
MILEKLSFRRTIDSMMVKVLDPLAHKLSVKPV